MAEKTQAGKGAAARGGGFKRAAVAFVIIEALVLLAVLIYRVAR